VHTLAFTPDGATLATASYDNTIKLWDMDEVTRSDVLPGHKDWALALAFSADNRMLASGGRDGVVKLWDSAAGTLLEEWNAKEPVAALAFGTDEKKMQLAVGAWRDDGAGSLKVLEVVSALGKLVVKELPPFETDKRGITCLAFGANNMLASGSVDGTAMLWDIAAGKSKHTFKVGQGVRSLGFSPSGSALAAGDAQGSVHLWNAATGEPLFTERVHDAAVAGLVVLGDEFVFVSAGADHTMKVWTWRAKKGFELLRTYRSHHQPLSSLAHLGGVSFATASWDHTVKLWDVREAKIGDERLTLLGHTGPVRALAISPNKQILASAGHDGVIRLWRASAPPSPK
jgi:WD40 repeat protein